MFLEWRLNDSVSTSIYLHPDGIFAKPAKPVDSKAAQPTIYHLGHRKRRRCQIQDKTLRLKD